MANSPPTVVVYDMQMLHCEYLVSGLKKLRPDLLILCFDDIGCLIQHLNSAGNCMLLIIDGTGNDRSFEAARRVHAHFPSLSFVVSVEPDKPERLVEAFKVGAAGVIHTDDSLLQVAKSIECVSMGEVWAKRTELRYLLSALTRAGPSVTDAAGRRLLTRREQEVAALVAEGLRNREISLALHLTQSTVKNHVFHIFEKLGISNRVELARYLDRSDEQ